MTELISIRQMLGIMIAILGLDILRTLRSLYDWVESILDTATNNLGKSDKRRVFGASIGLSRLRHTVCKTCGQRLRPMLLEATTLIGSRKYDRALANDALV